MITSSTSNKFATDCSVRNLSKSTGWPPCISRDALLQHTSRANYHTAIDRRALEPFMNAPTPHERGWIISFNEISIRWVTCNQAPINLMKDFACKCKRTHCNTNQSSFHCASASCTELCCCVNCNNT